MITSTVSSATAGSIDGALMEEVENTMSDDTLPKQLHYLTRAVISPIFCCIGIVGNLLSIITWSRPKMRSSTGRYLIGQAVADFGVLLFFLLESLQDWCPEIKYIPAYGWFFCYVSFPGLFFVFICSVWFTVGLTTDRYIMVCWITKAKRYCSEERANLGLFLITINVFFINIPHYFFLVPNQPAAIAHENDTMYQSQQDLILNTTMHSNNSSGRSGMGASSGGKGKNQAMEPVIAFVPTNFADGPSGRFYVFWIHCLSLIIVPWITVCFMNIRIIKAVSKSNKQNADKKTALSAKNSKASENQITRLLLTVTFTFLFIIGFLCVVQCFWDQKPVWVDFFYVDSSFAFAKCGITVNSSLNFFLYCMTGKRFRKELLVVLGLANHDSQISSITGKPSTSDPGRQTSLSTGTSGA